MNPITRRLQQQAREAEAGSLYPAKPARCSRPILRTGSFSGSRYVGNCKRPARASGLCWQHEVMA